MGVRRYNSILDHGFLLRRVCMIHCRTQPFYSKVCIKERRDAFLFYYCNNKNTCSHVLRIGRGSWSSWLAPRQDSVFDLLHLMAALWISCPRSAGQYYYSREKAVIYNVIYTGKYTIYNFYRYIIFIMYKIYWAVKFFSLWRPPDFTISESWNNISKSRRLFSNIEKNDTFMYLAFDICVHYI